MSLGDRLKEYRKQKGLSQEKLAEITSISKMSIRRYETNERQPKLETLDKIAEALGVDVWDLYEDYELKSARDNKTFWTSYLDDKLKQLGYSIGYNEEDAFLWINYPDGTLEVTEENLKELDKSTVSYLQFKLEELKREHIKDFKPQKYLKHT